MSQLEESDQSQLVTDNVAEDVEIKTPIADSLLSSWTTSIVSIFQTMVSRFAEGFAAGYNKQPYREFMSSIT